MAKAPFEKGSKCGPGRAGKPKHTVIAPAGSLVLHIRIFSPVRAFATVYSLCLYGSLWRFFSRPEVRRSRACLPFNNISVVDYSARWSRGAGQDLFMHLCDLRGRKENEHQWCHDSFAFCANNSIFFARVVKKCSFFNIIGELWVFNRNFWTTKFWHPR